MGRILNTVWGRTDFQEGAFGEKYLQLLKEKYFQKEILKRGKLFNFYAVFTPYRLKL